MDCGPGWVGVNWVRFALLGRGTDGWGAKLGSFRIIWPWGDPKPLEIGFVLHILGAVGHLVCENWVRFAQLVWGGNLVCWNWVRFAFFGVVVAGEVAGCGRLVSR